MNTDRSFPVLGCPAVSVPWWLVARHERQAVKNHGQHLETLVRLGGLAPYELLDVLNGMPGGTHPSDTDPGVLEQLVDRLTSPITPTMVTKRLDVLTLGFTGARIRFDYRPYAERSPDARADYDRLIVSIFHKGILAPLITTHDHHVLIGMRRAEIGRRLGIEKVRRLQVDEDVTQWWRDDVERLNALKAQMGATEY